MDQQSPVAPFISSVLEYNPIDKGICNTPVAEGFRLSCIIHLTPHQPALPIDNWHPRQCVMRQRAPHGPRMIYDPQHQSSLPSDHERSLISRDLYA